MADTAYLLGAGVNRSVSTRHGLTPPLALDFFRQAFRHPVFSTNNYQGRLSPLLDFIEKFWRLDKTQLLTTDFDLEECYTLLELQRREAHAQDDAERVADATRVQFLLTDFFIEYLSEFEYMREVPSAFRDFASVIYTSRATVLTFNYDILLESQLEAVSPVNDAANRAYMAREKAIADNRPALRATLQQQGLSEREIRNRLYSNDDIYDEHVGFSPHLWNQLLAYNVRFDEVALLTPGLTHLVPGDTYYANASNSEPHAPFLKLHGSLGWFVRSGYRIDGTPLPDSSTAGNTVVTRPSHIRGIGNIDYTGEILLPLILTPMLDKPYLAHPLLRELWKKARLELGKCKKLVIAGYSFPPTDFHVRLLLREVFSMCGPEELCVINPDLSVIPKAKDLCNYSGPVMACANLDEYLRSGA